MYVNSSWHSLKSISRTSLLIKSYVIDRKFLSKQTTYRLLKSAHLVSRPPNQCDYYFFQYPNVPLLVPVLHWYTIHPRKHRLLPPKPAFNAHQRISQSTSCPVWKHQDPNVVHFTKKQPAVPRRQTRCCRTCTRGGKGVLAKNKHSCHLDTHLWHGKQVTPKATVCRTWSFRHWQHK